tara:strand:+ start:109 stop:549 length:441 start_codon:yes stop_codon:yes gene_type:complete
MNQEEVHIDEITELVKFVFSDNKHNNRMVIESSDFKDTRDLYFFCIELTMKGMAYLYGDENEKVDIEKLSLEQLDNIKTKLSNAAIELIVDITPVKTNIDTNNHTEIIYDIPKKNREEESKLEEYSLKLIKKENLYDIRFKIMDYI